MEEALNAGDCRRTRNANEPSAASVNNSIAENRRRVKEMEKENRGYAKCVARINPK